MQKAATRHLSVALGLLREVDMHTEAERLYVRFTCLLRLRTRTLSDFDLLQLFNFKYSVVRFWTDCVQRFV